MAASLSSVARLLRSPAALRPYASIGEQVLMSGTNLAISIVVVRVGGVAALGVYSFLFVVGSLLNGFFATLLHRQMMLSASGEDDASAASIFLRTVCLELVFAGTLLVGVGGTLAWLSLIGDTPRWTSAILCATIYLVVYNLFDLTRQYLYTRDAQVASLRYTSMYAAAQMLALLATLVIVEGDRVVAVVFLGSAISHAISLLVNREARSAARRAARPTPATALATLRGYFEHARFGLLGMFVTWLQNQSMNPFLMLVGGATLAGQFSLARLMVMPVAVVGQGLVNSSTPALRRLFKQQGAAAVDARAWRFGGANLAVWLAWSLTLLFFDLTGLSGRFVPDYGEVRWFLGLWVCLLLGSLTRFWSGQRFVVSMRFRFLLETSLIATAISVIGMGILGLGLDMVRPAVAFGFVGELIAIALFARERRRERHAG